MPTWEPPECRCKGCGWMGQWYDTVKNMTYPGTEQDQEEIENLCPLCGYEVEEIDV